MIEWNKRNGKSSLLLSEVQTGPTLECAFYVRMPQWCRPLLLFMYEKKIRTPLTRSMGGGTSSTISWAQSINSNTDTPLIHLWCLFHRCHLGGIPSNFINNAVGQSVELQSICLHHRLPPFGWDSHGSHVPLSSMIRGKPSAAPRPRPPMVGAAADAAAKVPSLKMEEGTPRCDAGMEGQKKKSKNNSHLQKLYIGLPWFTFFACSYGFIY